MQSYAQHYLVSRLLSCFVTQPELRRVSHPPRPAIMLSSDFIDSLRCPPTILYSPLFPANSLSSAFESFSDQGERIRNGLAGRAGWASLWQILLGNLTSNAQSWSVSLSTMLCAYILLSTNGPLAWSTVHRYLITSSAIIHVVCGLHPPKKDAFVEFKIKSSLILASTGTGSYVH